MPQRISTPDSASGLQTSSGNGLDEELAAVFQHWSSAGLHSEQTLARMSETVTRFTARLRATAVCSFADVTPAAAAAFVTARTRGGLPPEVATQHARRTAVRTLYRSLRAIGYRVGDPTLDVVLPPRGLLAARPLTDDEVALCRISAQLGAGAPVRTLAWALGEATAVSSEISQIRLADLDNPADPCWVVLRGTSRHDPRRGQLSQWGRRVVAGHAARLLRAGAPPDTPLAYTGAAPLGGAKAQAAVCNALRVVLDRAGLAGEPDVRPASLRNWAGRALFDNGMAIEQVACRLGCRKLDTAAEDIALVWRQVSA